MREVCNLGYGRYSCDQFPTSAVADSIRFHVAEDAGESVTLQYVFEKDCWPGDHGCFEYSVTQKFSVLLDDDILRRQADAFLESYLRRRNGA